MKKKIKDLIYEECMKICENHLCNNKCPLFIYADENYCVFCFRELIADNKLEEEVEVDE